MNLPGLNFNPYDYPEYNGSLTDGDYRMIPFADWLPPDHEDVFCERGDSLKEMYYSPASNMMVPSDSEKGYCAFEPKDLTFWLKRVS